MSAIIQKADHKRDKTIAHVCMSIAIMIIVGLVPPIGSITPIGMKVIGVFLGAIYGWSVSNPIWPSLLAFVALPFTGVTTTKELITGGWGSEVVIFTAFSLMIIRYLDDSGVSRYIAYWLMSRKILTGRPWLISFTLLLAAYLICSFVKIYVGVFVLWSTIYSVSKALGYKPYDKYPTVMILGVTLMGCLSLTALPYSGNAIILLGAFTAMTDITINMGHYMLYTMPCGFLTIVVYILLCKFVFRVDVSLMKNFDKTLIDQDELALNKEKSIALCTLFGFVIMLLIPGILPKEFILTKIFGTMGIVGVALLVVGALTLIKVDGKHVFNLAECAAKGVQWPLLMMPMIILPLGNAMTAESTGIKGFLLSSLSPMLEGLSPILFLLVLGIIAVCLTNVFINIIIGMILLPIGIAFAVPLGISEIQIAYFIIMCVSIALLTPAASSASVLMFANDQWIKPKDVYKYGAVTVVATFIVAITVNYFWISLFC